MISGVPNNLVEKRNFLNAKIEVLFFPLSINLFMKHSETFFKSSPEKREEETFLTMEEGLCGDEEGSGAHPQQHNELQEPEAEGQTKWSNQILIVLGALLYSIQ